MWIEVMSALEESDKRNLSVVFRVDYVFFSDSVYEVEKNIDFFVLIIHLVALQHI